jgi:CubicO group peptidase (beta-lactamase class C family)
MYVTKNILSPLGMSRSFFDRTPYHLIHDRSRSYFRTDEGLKEAMFDFDTGITVSNGGLNAPLTDMARYLAFLAGDERQAATYERVLWRESLEEMFKPVAPASDGEGGSGPNVQVGLSFFLERHEGLDLVAHSGNKNGFLSHLYIHLPSRTAFIVAYNTDVRTRKDGVAEVTRAVDAELRDEMLRRVFR